MGAAGDNPLIGSRIQSRHPMSVDLWITAETAVLAGNVEPRTIRPCQGDTP